MPRKAIIRSLSMVSAGGTYDDLFLDDWPVGQLICWCRLVALDRTTDLTRIELSLLRGSERYVLKSSNITAAALSAHTSETFAAPGDFRVGARFYGATDGDVLELYAFGEIVTPDEAA